jgi:RimJ/RimL family protein N-acetyltransferase
MQLDLGDCTIRDLVAHDAAALVKHANDRRVSIQLRDLFPFPYTAASAAAFLERACAEQPRSSFAIATDAELIGGIKLQRGGDVHHRSAEVGYWLAVPFWGRGIATRAVRALADWAFANHDLVRLFAGVFETNPASARVLEKAGFELEGRLRLHVTKDGRTCDELLYARLRAAP